jgi:hypothetical protein
MSECSVTVGRICWDLWELPGAAKMSPDAPQMSPRCFPDTSQMPPSRMPPPAMIPPVAFLFQWLLPHDPSSLGFLPRPFELVYQGNSVWGLVPGSCIS